MASPSTKKVCGCNIGWLKTLPIALIAVAAIGTASASVEARDSYVDDGLLRIASWNLSDAEDAGAIKRPKKTERRWRTSFGAELRSKPRSKFAGERLKADVILLQGVSSIREVRRIFPARDWKLIVSRQILKFGSGRLNVDSELAGRRTTTAIAVRYQRQVRVTGLEHLLDLGTEDEASPNVAAVPIERTSASAAEPAVAALAVRIAFSQSVLWVVSSVLPSACRQSQDTCSEATALSGWANKKRGQGFGVVIGGQLHANLRAKGDASNCAGQELVADKTLEADVGADAIAGCMTFADLRPLGNL